MEVTEDVDVIYEELQDEGLVKPVNESTIDNCLRDTDGSLSSLNLDIFTDSLVPPKPAKGRRKKTMEKRKEERMSFKHVVDKAIASDVEDDVDFSSMSSCTSVDSDFSPQNIDKRFLEYRFREASLLSKSKKTKVFTVKGKTSGYSKKLPKMIRINAEDNKDASTSREYNSTNLNKALLALKSDDEKQSKSDNERNLDHLAKVVIADMFKQKRKKSLLRSKSTDELRNYEDDNAGIKDFVVTSTGEHWIVSDEDKRILLSPESVAEEKSKSKEFQNMEVANNVIEDVETPSTSKYINVPKKGLGGVKRILLPESDEEENRKSRKERDFIDAVSYITNVGTNMTLRKKRRVSDKREEVTDNAHVYNFFSSMADLVSTLPYSATLTAKARVTKILAEMVERAEKLQRRRFMSPITIHDICEEDLKLIKLRLSMLPYIY